MANRDGFTGRLWAGATLYAPVILLGVSLYYVALVIVPFLALGIYRAPLNDLVLGKGPYYFYALGWPALIVTLLLRALQPLLSLVWLLAAIRFGSARKLWILAVLLLAPLPIAWVNAGPYADHILGWLEFQPP